MSAEQYVEPQLLRGIRVVFVLAGEVLGGAERGQLDLARDLAHGEGASVAVCALDDRPGRARELAIGYGIPWHSVKVSWVGNQAARGVSLARLVARLRRLSPDALVSATNLPNVACGLTWRMTGASVSVWNQCDVNRTSRISQRLFRRALSSTPVVVTAAWHAREWLVDTFGADPGRVRVIPTSVSRPAPHKGAAAWRARLGLADDAVVACMLGHFHSGKDHATLLHAWRLVSDRLTANGGRSILILAGRDAGGADATKALAFDLDLRDHVLFVGEVDDVDGLLAAVDLAVLSSRRECFPRGVLEPMAAGLAVVGTDVPGIREALGTSGEFLLSPPGDAPALAQAILRLIDDPDLRTGLGRSNAELIRSRPSPEATSQVFARVLSEGLAGKLP